MRACAAVALAAAVSVAGIEGTAAADAPAPSAKAAPPAAAKGKPSLTAYYVKGFDDAAWQQKAFGKVAKSWVATTPPALGKKVVVISQITRAGKVLEAKVGTASGSEAWDKAALDAVKAAAPFPALPAKWVESSVEVHWHFSYSK